MSISHFKILYTRRARTKAFAYQLFTAVVLFTTITIVRLFALSYCLVMTFAECCTQHVGNNLAHATTAYTSSTTEAMISITARHTILDDIGRATTSVAAGIADLFLVSLLLRPRVVKLTGGSLNSSIYFQVYRVHVLWSFNWRISALPFLLWLAWVVLGIVTSDDSLLHSDTIPDLALLYLMLTALVLNFVGTCMYRTLLYVLYISSFLSLTLSCL